ncbi:cellulase family glycosylhydrolase [Nocardioides sp. Arc9.136]|uniref:cellulase family glycosylhydrolase n=1 Tax=Nocardioides sp. Arc9.136 TaxID=2996826 RepID=UPI0026657E8B|nr:cellulase family glycosylhydrolase [Nocardioides sp. Arc9.136]WKN46984.1 cellulase family glycosylhydrolase [Nocardioides sp. Arc9.136]
MARSPDREGRRRAQRSSPIHPIRNRAAAAVGTAALLLSTAPSTLPSATAAPAAAPAATPAATPAAKAGSPAGVVNGGAERGTTGWSLTGAPKARLTTSGTSRSGDRALQVRSARPGTVRLDGTATSRATRTPAGTTTTARAWVRSAVRGQRVTLVARELRGGSWVHSERRTVTPAAGTWTRLRVPVTTTRARSTVELRLVVRSSGSQVRLLVDDADLRARRTGAGAAPVDAARAGTLTNGCAYSARGVPSCGAYFGATYGSNTDPTAFESQVGRRLGVRRTFYNASGVDSAVRQARTDLAHGRLPWMSFKLPLSWEQMASGAGDAWATGLARKLAALDGPVWVAFHHEPEGDGDIAAWRRMQERLAPLVRRTAPNVAYTVVLTGWNQLYGASTYSLANLWPRGVEIDVAGFDIYNGFGAVKDGKKSTKWTEIDRDYFAKIQRWAADEGVAWGLAEWGYTDEAHQRDPDWIQTTYDQLVARGGVAAAYFNTELNSAGSWRIASASKRQDFADAIDGTAALRLP